MQFSSSKATAAGASRRDTGRAWSPEHCQQEVPGAVRCYFVAYGFGRECG